jgi:CBS domain-containing protein
MAGRDALAVMEAGHLVGIVSRAELEAVPEADDRQPLVACIRPRVAYCFADTPPEEALATMQVAGVEHLAVLGDDLGLLGLLARGTLPAGLRPMTPGTGRPGEGTAPGLDR